MALHLNVDHRDHEVHDLPPETTLLQWMRAQRLTAPKEGCNEGDCGACAVLLQDEQGRLRAVNSCLVLLPMVHGRRVLTAAGLARNGLHPAQAALVARSGSQCGYCTPGFVAALAEAAHRPELAQAAPDDARLHDALSGNLCRCTGYRPIQQALHEVAGTCPESPFPSTPPPGGRVEYEALGRRFLAPTELDEALRALADGARIVHGATDLGLSINLRHQTYDHMISLERIDALHRLESTAEGHRIGAGVPLAELEDWSADQVPVLHRMLRYFGSRLIKNRATLGGNLANASPIGDLAPVLLALDARLHLRSHRGPRVVPIDHFFRGYRQTALEADELIEAVQVPRAAADTRMSAFKVSRRRELDICAVSAAFALRVEEGRVAHVRLAYGGMAATPARALRTEAALLGRPWDAAALREALPRLDDDFQPIDDHRGSALFRRRLARNLLLGFQIETAREAFRPLPSGHVATVLP